MVMQGKTWRAFFLSAGMLLGLTGLAKLVSSTGRAHILLTADPIFHISFRTLFLILGILELAVAAICFLRKRWELPAFLVAALSTNFVLYRLGMVWVGYTRPCPCLGNLTDALHIPPVVADYVLKIILAYLFIGSYAALFTFWNQRRRSAHMSQDSIVSGMTS